MWFLKLPEFRPGISTQIADAKSCRQWLADLPLTNIQQSHAAIATQLDLLNHYKTSPLERLKVTEQLREPIAYLQAEIGKKYIGKPIPLNAAMQASWKQVYSLWQAIFDSYQHCLQGCVEDNPEIKEFMPVVTQRCLLYTGLLMREHYHAYQQLDPALWEQLHGLYTLSEDKGFASRTVKDNFNKQQEATSCAGAYVHVLLTHLAHPYQMTHRQLQTLEKWLDKWSVRVPIATEKLPTPNLSTLAVDLEGKTGIVNLRKGDKLNKQRFLDIEPLSIHIKQRIKFLHDGGTPSEAGLGEECVQPSCENFLTALYQHWCELPVTRADERIEQVDKAQLSFGMAAMHFFCNDEQPFKQPENSPQVELDSLELEDLQLYGRVTRRIEKLKVSQLGFALETWQIMDYSVHGFRLMRSASSAGATISHNQLLIIRPSNIKQFVLGVVRWLTKTTDDQLHIGVHTFPGEPYPISAKPVAAISNTVSKFVQAFLMPAIAAEDIGPTLILPLGWFQPGRLVEIYTHELQTVKLVSLVDKGSDFDRVAFEAIVA